MKCVHCGDTLHQEKYEGVAVDTCHSCNGIWLDYGEISQIIDSRKKKFSLEEKIVQISRLAFDESLNETYYCPVCKKQMERFEYAINSGVILDRCPDDHGIWFDKDELERLQIVMEEGDRNHEDAKIELQQTPGIKMCPRCALPLHEVVYENIYLDHCSKCGGYWCDRDELAQVIFVRLEKLSFDDYPEVYAKNSGKKISKPEELVGDLPCVLCGSRMDRTNYSYSSGIIIDNCSKGHGIWLDNGELEKIQLFSEQSDEVDKRDMDKIRALLEREEDNYKMEYNKNIDNIKVSRFSTINRIIQSFYRYR